MKRLSLYYVLAGILFHNTWFSKYIPSEEYLRIIYKGYTGKRLNLRAPVTFNEKIQWLKINYCRLDYATMADKYEAKKYVADRIGETHIIPTLALFNSVEDIDISQLPGKFVLKCTHDSGSVILVKNKADFDLDMAKRRIKNAVSRNFYYPTREWSYKSITPRIIAEEFVESASDKQIMDYKIYCFNGEPKLIEVDYDRFTNHKRNLYDLDWNYIDASIGYPSDPDRVIEKPEKLEEMLDYARVLSEGIPLIRTDFYYIDGNILFGELTFYPDSGFGRFDPEEFGIKMGELIQLPHPIR